MIFTLAGNNTFGLRRRLDEMTGKFTAKYGNLALEKFDGEEDEAKTIIEGLQSLPFLAAKKLVLVRSGGANKEFSEKIEQVISSISETTNVVFYEPQMDKRTAYFKVLKSKSQFEEFNELDPQSLVRWLVGVAKNQGGQIGLADANYLVERVGKNQSLLANELNKLLTYQSEITRQNIDLLTEPTPQSKVFDLLDTAFAGHKGQALRLYEDQRAQKVEPQAILAMIAWQLHLIALAKQAGQRPITEVSRDSGMKEYPLSKAKNLADKLSDKDLKYMVSAALDIDWKGKTTALDMDEALKNFIISL